MKKNEAVLIIEPGSIAYIVDEMEIIPGKQTLKFEMYFECENCGFINEKINLMNMNAGNGYIHCNKCDSYYKLIYNAKETSELSFYLEKIPKKEVMENTMFAKHGYTIMEV